MKIQIFWDVILCQWAVPNSLKDCSALDSFTLKTKALHSFHMLQNTQWHNVTFQNISTVSTMAVRTSRLALSYVTASHEYRYLNVVCIGFSQCNMETCKCKYSIYVNKNPTDATVCRYLFTAKLLYMFWVSQHPLSGVLKTVPAASGTGHTTCTGGCGYSF